MQASADCRLASPFCTTEQPMDVRNDFMHSLLDGLPETDQADLLESIREAHDEQLDRKRHPRRRRRRNAEGMLVPPPLN